MSDTTGPAIAAGLVPSPQRVPIMARLFDLVAVFLAPLAAALDQEFGRPAPAARSSAIAATATPPAEPLYTRRGTGRGTRYDPAHADATGPKFRKAVLPTGRTKYLPA